MRLELPQSEPILPVTVENLRALLVAAVDMGRIQLTEHFKQRSRERRITTVEAERIIRNGDLTGSPVFCLKFKNWRCRLLGTSCSRALEIRVGLNFELDLGAPVVVLITGISKGRIKSCKAKSLKPLRL
jgi:hypothetical protein